MANKDTQRTSAESYRDDRKARLAQSAKKSQKKSEKSKAAAKIVKMVVAIVLAVVVAGGIVWKVLDDTAAIKATISAFRKLSLHITTASISTISTHTLSSTQGTA